MTTDQNEDALNDAIGLVEDGGFESGIQEIQDALGCATSCEAVSDVTANLKEAKEAAQQLVKDLTQALKDVARV
jgi:hypothetical protein